MHENLYNDFYVVWLRPKGTHSRAHTATVSTRPCVSKTQTRGSRAHTRPRTRVDVKLSHRLTNCSSYPKEFVRFLIKLWPVLDIIFACCMLEEVPFFLKSTKILHTTEHQQIEFSI